MTHLILIESLRGDAWVRESESYEIDARDMQDAAQNARVELAEIVSEPFIRKSRTLRARVVPAETGGREIVIMPGADKQFEEILQAAYRDREERAAVAERFWS